MARRARVRLKEWARATRRDAHALYLAARDTRTPWYAKAVAAAIAAYALSPIDLIPDFIPVLGLLDEVILLPVGMWIVMRLIPEEVMAEHRATAALAAGRPVSRRAAVTIVVIWFGLAAVGAWLAYRLLR